MPSITASPSLTKLASPPIAKRTVMQALEDTAGRFGDDPALGYKQNGTYATLSWRDYRELVRTCAKGFIKLGLQPKEGVSLLGFNCKEWSIADLAAIYAGGIPAGIYTTSSPQQCQYIASHSDSVIVVVENEEALAKFLAVRGELPRVKALVVMHGVPAVGQNDVLSFEELLALGRGVPEMELEARIAAQNPDDVCTLIYTSGTTGNPKAVMISHDNLTFTAATVTCVFELSGEKLLSYLPLSHVAEQVVCMHAPIACASTVYFAESMEKLAENLREVRPTVFLGVPRVWEKIQAKMIESAKTNPPLKRKIAAWARKTGLRDAYAVQTGARRPRLTRLADKLVFRKVRAALGLDRCRLALTSAAPISRGTLEFFLSLGIPLVENYGMSEVSGPGTLSLADRYRVGSVGFALPGTELKIADDGEICMRGRHVFKGYFKDPAATAESLDDEGFLHSGDIGELDRDGFLRITDRKKDLLITAGGENVAPQTIEGALRDIPVVAHAVVVGDREKHLAALLTIDPTKLAEATRAAGSAAQDLTAAATCPKIHAWLMAQVDAVNRDLARVQTIKKIKVLPAEFSIEGGELTPTMKIKRKVVYEKYREQIRVLYRD